MVTETPEASLTRPRLLARVRRTTLVFLGGLVAAVVTACLATTVVLSVLRPDTGIAWLVAFHGLWLLAALLVVGHVARVISRFLEDVFYHQDRVAAAIAHEVRSPLSRLTVSLEEGLTGVIDAEVALAEARHETEGLGQLVDDLLLAGQVLSGAVPAPRQPVRLDTLVATVPDGMMLGEATATVEAEPLALVGSSRLLRLSLVNLVRNAVQHAYRGGPGHIELRVDRDGVAVIDNGPGIPEEQLAVLNGAPRVGAGGRRVGLGFQLAEWVAELHGGHLLLSNRPGGGLEARLSLPVEPAPAANGTPTPRRAEPLRAKEPTRG